MSAALHVDASLIEETLAEDGIEVLPDQRVRPILQTSYVRPSKRLTTPRHQESAKPSVPDVRQLEYKLVGSDRLVVHGLTTAVAVGSHVCHDGVDYEVKFCGETPGETYLVRAKRVHR